MRPSFVLLSNSRAGRPGIRNRKEKIMKSLFRALTLASVVGCFLVAQAAVAVELELRGDVLTRRRNNAKTRKKERAAHTSRFGSSGGSLRLGAFALIPFLDFSDGAAMQVEIITVAENQKRN